MRNWAAEQEMEVNPDDVYARDFDGRESTLVLEHRPGTENFGTHPATQCEGQVCCIHNRSNHSMRSFPQYWRFDRELMERICPHGVGHPDPDHLAFVRLMRGDDAARTESIHGCDGCCK